MSSFLYRTAIKIALLVFTLTQLPSEAQELQPMSSEHTECQKRMIAGLDAMPQQQSSCSTISAHLAEHSYRTEDGTIVYEQSLQNERASSNVTPLSVLRQGNHTPEILSTTSSFDDLKENAVFRGTYCSLNVVETIIHLAEFYGNTIALSTVYSSKANLTPKLMSPAMTTALIWDTFWLLYEIPKHVLHTFNINMNILPEWFTYTETLSAAYEFPRSSLKMGTSLMGMARSGFTVTIKGTGVALAYTSLWVNSIAIYLSSLQFDPATYLKSFFSAAESVEFESCPSYQAE